MSCAEPSPWILAVTVLAFWAGIFAILFFVEEL
jgi:hypothetical protein